MFRSTDEKTRNNVLKMYKRKSLSLTVSKAMVKVNCNNLDSTLHWNLMCIRKRNYISKCLQAGGPVVEFQDHTLVSYHKGPDFPVLTHLLNLVKQIRCIWGGEILAKSSIQICSDLDVWPLLCVSHPALDVRVPAVPSVTCGASWVEIRIAPAHLLIYDHYHITTARAGCKHTFIPHILLTIVAHQIALILLSCLISKQLKYSTMYY